MALITGSDYNLMENKTKTGAIYCYNEIKKGLIYCQ